MVFTSYSRLIPAHITHFRLQKYDSTLLKNIQLANQPKLSKNKRYKTDKIGVFHKRPAITALSKRGAWGRIREEGMSVAIQVLYQDRDIVVCVKPAGVLSEGEGMPALLRQQLGGEAYCVHRLDRDVGGVMVYARTKTAAAELSAMIASRAFGKEYLAVVQGNPAADAAVLRDLLYHDATRNKSYVVKRPRRGVREAELDYERLSTQNTPDGALSLLRVRLHTGRSHQIRVQFASRSMPLVGDGRYGSRYPKEDLALWSERVCFRHPITGEELRFSALPPGNWSWTLYE